MKNLQQIVQQFDRFYRKLSSNPILILFWPWYYQYCGQVFLKTKPSNRYLQPGKSHVLAILPPNINYLLLSHIPIQIQWRCTVVADLKCSCIIIINNKTSLFSFRYIFYKQSSNRGKSLSNDPQCQFIFTFIHVRNLVNKMYYLSELQIHNFIVRYIFFFLHFLYAGSRRQKGRMRLIAF